MSGVKALGSTLGSAASGGLKIFTAGVAGAAAGVSALGMAAVKSYADYEQLVGGIETLFGAGGASISEYAKTAGKSISEIREEYDTLMAAQTLALNNAQVAYQTAGLSANAYMETVTSFAASLKQSTENELEAAEAANQAVIDMSDNANKMGTSMELIQNAYQGFAKQNYTMLDNLKLGYGGTKEEMKRLLADAEALTGIKYDIENLNDVYSAIHVIQTELGIAGTTAKEASTTISGSANAMKAAWSNLLTGIADDSQDFDSLVDNFVTSAATFAENIMPRFESALNGIGSLIEKLFPVIIARIPAIINEVLPDLVQSGINMITSLAEGIQQNLPQIMSAGSDLLSSLANGIITALPMLATTAYDIVMNLLTGISGKADSLIQSGSELILKFATGMAEKIPDLLAAGGELITALAGAIIDNLPVLADAAHQIVDSLLEGIGDLSPALKPITDALQVLADNFDIVLAVIVPLTAAFLAWKAAVSIAGIIQAFSTALNGMTVAQYAAKMAQDLLNASMLANPIILIVTLIAALVAGFIYLWNTSDEFRQFWIDLWEGIKEVAGNVIDAIVGFFTETIPNAVSGLIDFVKNNWQTLLMLLNPATMLAGIFKLVYDNCEAFRTFVDGFVQSIKDFFVNAWNSILAFFTETLPSLPEKFMYWLGQVVAAVISWKNDMIEKAREAGSNFVSGVVDFVSSLPGKIASFLGNVIGNVIGFATNLKNRATEAGRGFFENIVSALTDLPAKMGEIGSNIVSGIWNGITSGWKWLVDSVKNLATNLFSAAKEALDIHSPSRKFKWIGEMCVAGMDEPIADYDPYDTLDRTLKVGAKGMTASLAVADHGQAGAAERFDYDRMGMEMRNAMGGMAVNMDSKPVGKLVASAVDEELGRINGRRT